MRDQGFICGYNPELNGGPLAEAVKLTTMAKAAG